MEQGLSLCPDFVVQGTHENKLTMKISQITVSKQKVHQATFPLFREHTLFDLNFNILIITISEQHAILQYRKCVLMSVVYPEIIFIIFTQSCPHQKEETKNIQN